jgi:hypothetical protein
MDILVEIHRVRSFVETPYHSRSGTYGLHALKRDRYCIRCVLGCPVCRECARDEHADPPHNVLTVRECRQSGADIVDAEEFTNALDHFHANVDKGTHCLHIFAV